MNSDLRLRTTLAISAVKSLIVVYDILSLPFYFVAQRPWKKWLKTSVWGKPQKAGDVSGPWVRFGDHTEPPLPGIQTVDELFRTSVNKYGKTQCFGTREVKGEEEEVQKDGKVFKK
ncbi:long-chain-fatty-acid--CoA ligase 4-like, partial [Limulus polyphemus]|uniref:Long-chain-fatty-acid--CoA ligase 4-like n=1 Tax=Limulus polyphemus TaxID=6850 RepID=A0ABM1BSB4_LIMPO